LKTVSVEKKELLQVVPLKIDRFVTRIRGSEKCENNINQNPVRAGARQVRLHLLELIKLISVSKLHHLSVLR
jgi:hypothetical protein